MQVRTGDQHTFPTAEATTTQYVVVGTPMMDHAARALHDAQAKYFAAYPEAKKWARSLLWTIEPDASSDNYRNKE